MMSPTLTVKNTFISVDALEGDLEGPSVQTKTSRHVLARSRSQGSLGRDDGESEQIRKLNRILESDKDAVREARSPMKTTPAGTATPPSSEDSSSESMDVGGWIELGSYGALPASALREPAGKSCVSELQKLKEKLQQVCQPDALASTEAALHVDGKGIDRNGSNASVSTMTSFEANRSRAFSNGSIMTDCFTEDRDDSPVEFDLTIEEEPGKPWDEKKWSAKERYARSDSGGSWGGPEPLLYGPTSWYPAAEQMSAPMGYNGSPFNTPMPSPSQWAQDKCYGYKDKSSRGLPRESRHNRVPKNVNLQAEFQSAGEITTLMIRNIPNRYTQRELMQELEELGFANKFDFLYSPLDKGTMSNVGYAFVNFKTPQWAAQCMQAFQSYRFKRHRKTSGKVAAVSAAHLQGLEANLAHYEKTAVNTAKMKQRRPVVLASISSLTPSL
ncbi:ML4 [Symbiodinium natans]|uniref:ML4 protein n=1 Tax=Symbiodinium natans TaxID=878477 RepID=A0A812MK69_9DINO|nr:ML4 [Symbiodinium natans]